MEQIEKCQHFCAGQRRRIHGRYDRAELVELVGRVVLRVGGVVGICLCGLAPRLKGASATTA